MEVAGHDFVFQQSPGLLNSHRKGGTTGAVMWKITPLLAAWLATIPSILADALRHDAVVVELGCGVAGLIGLVVSQLVGCYVLTDQHYVMKLLRENITANSGTPQESKQVPKKKQDKTQYGRRDVLKTLPLDWETDSSQNLKTVIPGDSSIDLVLLCDCVYNEYLIGPLVQTCVDLCRLESSTSSATVVLIAQQLRSDIVLQVFLESMMKDFDVWRVPDEEISNELHPSSGYVVHLALLRNSSDRAE